MLEVWTKFVSAIMLSLYGFYVIKKLTKSEAKLLNVKSILYLVTLCIVTVYFHKIQYTGTHTVAIFALQIIIYKVIFNISTEESLIACGILMMLTILGDVFCGLLLRNFYSVNEIRNNGYIGIIANVIVIALGIAIIKVKYILRQLQVFYNNISKSKSISNILFTILLIIGLSSLSQNTTKTSGVNSGYLINIMVMLIFFILTYLFIRSKNSYDKLNSEYESMFSYVQNFEDWIEKEQLNRHEYKNQLAVLRCLTSEKKVKDKIDEILEDSINVEGEVVHQLKTLPKNGIKGLMYYKSAIAQKNKIDLTVNISLEVNSILFKLSEKEAKVLCHLIGIYFDNAIEAAKETRKKKVLIEIYEIKDHVTFVFSNTFKKAKNFDDRNKKGVSTKGDGHGNGLYYASKLIDQNPWLSQKQEVIDKYYIQQIIVTRKNDRK
jgi:two-component system, LytTR family, sensor histidine kinase AgrC